MQLNELPFNELKIDQSFIQKITTNEKSSKIVEATIKMAESLSLKVVAEGVETTKQLELVTTMGCHSIQGYIFSKPLQINELLQYVSQQA